MEGSTTLADADDSVAIAQGSRTMTSQDPRLGPERDRFASTDLMGESGSEIRRAYATLASASVGSTTRIDWMAKRLTTLEDSIAACYTLHQQKIDSVQAQITGLDKRVEGLCAVHGDLKEAHRETREFQTTLEGQISLFQPLQIRQQCLKDVERKCRDVELKLEEKYKKAAASYESRLKGQANEHATQIKKLIQTNEQLSGRLSDYQRLLQQSEHTIHDRVARIEDEMRRAFSQGFRALLENDPLEADSVRVQEGGRSESPFRSSASPASSDVPLVRLARNPVRGSTRSASTESSLSTISHRDPNASSASATRADSDTEGTQSTGVSDRTNCIKTEALSEFGTSKTVGPPRSEMLEEAAAAADEDTIARSSPGCSSSSELTDLSSQSGSLHTGPESHSMCGQADDAQPSCTTAVTPTCEDVGPADVVQQAGVPDGTVCSPPEPERTRSDSVESVSFVRLQAASARRMKQVTKVKQEACAVGLDPSEGTTPPLPGSDGQSNLPSAPVVLTDPDTLPSAIQQSTEEPQTSTTLRQATPSASPSPPSQGSTPITTPEAPEKASDQPTSHGLTRPESPPFPATEGVSSPSQSQHITPQAGHNVPASPLRSLREEVGRAQSAVATRTSHPAAPNEGTARTRQSTNVAVAERAHRTADIFQMKARIGSQFTFRQIFIYPGLDCAESFVCKAFAEQLVQQPPEVSGIRSMIVKPRGQQRTVLETTVLLPRFRAPLFSFAKERFKVVDRLNQMPGFEDFEEEGLVICRDLLDAFGLSISSCDASRFQLKYPEWPETWSWLWPYSSRKRPRQPSNQDSTGASSRKRKERNDDPTASTATPSLSERLASPLDLRSRIDASEADGARPIASKRPRSTESDVGAFVDRNELSRDPATEPGNLGAPLPQEQENCPATWDEMTEAQRRECQAKTWQAIQVVSKPRSSAGGHARPLSADRQLENRRPVPYGSNVAVAPHRPQEA